MGVFPSVPGQAQPGRDTPGQPGPVLPNPQPSIPLTAQLVIPMPIAGFGYQQADMANLWAGAAAFFQQRVVLRATQVTTATTLPSGGAITAIGYDNITEDPYQGWIAGNKQWAAPFSGWYQVNVTVWVAAPGAANVVLEPYAETLKTPGNAMNGRNLTAVVIPNDIAGAEGTWITYLTDGDVVWGAANVKNSASNVTTNLTVGQNSALEVIWLSS